eukprot:scaffold49324_cov60-Phaeocystis_antarctica.AAC.2
MTRMGLDLPTKDVDGLFDSWDPSGGGTLDFKELQKRLTLTLTLTAHRSPLTFHPHPHPHLHPYPHPHPNPNPNPNPHPQPHPHSIYHPHPNPYQVLRSGAPAAPAAPSAGAGFRKANAGLKAAAALQGKARKK